MSAEQRLSFAVLVVFSLLLVFTLTTTPINDVEKEILAPDHVVIASKSPLVAPHLPKSPLIAEIHPLMETAPPTAFKPIVSPAVETKGVPTTHFMHGDSFAGEWKLALPLVEEARNMTFIIHSNPAIIWFTPRNGYFKNYRAAPGEPQELFGKVMQGFWDDMLAWPGRKVVFLVTPTIYLRSIYIDEENSFKPGEPGWKDEIVASIFEYLDPMLQNDPQLRFVNLLAHSLPYGLAGCIARESDLSKCEPQPQSKFPGKAEYLLALEELEGVWGDRFLKVSIQDIVCPHEMCTAGDEQGRPMYKDSMHLKPEWLRDHIAELDARLAPFY